MPERFTLHSPVTALHGVGAAGEKHLLQLGITTIEDLLLHLPFRYEDYRTLIPIADLRIGQSVTIAGTIEIIASRRSWKKRMTITEALVRDDSGTMKAIWFNQPFLSKNLKPNDRVMLAGKVTGQAGSAQLVSPAYEKMDRGETLHVGRLVPIYPTTKGLTERQLRYFVSQALRVAQELPDPLPKDVLTNERLMPLPDAITTLHFPDDEHARDQALKRLTFDELLIYHLRREQHVRKLSMARAPAIPFDAKFIQDFIASLPFTLTASQDQAAKDIFHDLELQRPMYRLLEGDTGSGKTAVALLAALNVAEAGWRAAFMAPTEILAQQHFATFSRLLKKTQTSVVLWTHAFHELARSGKGKKLRTASLNEQLPDGGAIIIGTQALLDQRAVIERLGLAIVDEQHRFGVLDSQRLQNMRTHNKEPHVLSLTATPIPRSLALTIAGNLALSVLTEKPQGRKPILTKYIPPQQRSTLYRRVDHHLGEGRQAFVIAPLIEPSDRVGVVSATTLAEELQATLARRRVGLLHGKMTSTAKETILMKFANHEIDLLVATPIVEVGIDAPNATIMIIEGAERFGLAQLHQIRGRVGRGDQQSFCFLLATTITPLAAKRLEAVRATNDGFRLAELDLELRGPGDLVGTMQSGFLDFQFASLGDHEMVERTAQVARQILEKDAELKLFPLLREKVSNKLTPKE